MRPPQYAHKTSARDIFCKLTVHSLAIGTQKVAARTRRSHVHAQWAVLSMFRYIISTYVHSYTNQTHDADESRRSTIDLHYLY